MPLTLLRLNQFRNFTTAEINPCEIGFNIISGNNGSGKTSLLEAIYYLSHGRSFRASVGKRLIQHHEDKFSIFSQLVNAQGVTFPVGLEKDQHGGQRSRIDGEEAASIASIATHLPVRLINSQSHNIFEAGPNYRRRYLDWGLFYAFDGFLPCWRQYERALKQRNALLKSRRPAPELTAWTDALITHGLVLNGYRRQYVDSLDNYLQPLVTELLGADDITIDYDAGWKSCNDFASALAALTTDEWRAGFTLAGPHRADLLVYKAGVPVQHILSRGQQKLLICAMIIAQGMLLAAEVNRSLIYLIDDLPAELDETSKQKLIALLTKQQTQVFITAIDSASITNDLKHHPAVTCKVFHVEHGAVNQETQALSAGVDL